MTRKLLDTTFLIHHWGGHDDVATYLESQPADATFFTTTLNLKEIAVGRRLVDQFDAAEIRRQFEWIRTVPVTESVAWETAALEAPLYADETIQRDRINSLSIDALVAGAAAELGATVVSKNVTDFETLDVPVESY
ncbi:type II toxin-antitoxin system VapC family toxin [Halovivax limisalsi]|uniref:type II toxin-antitoxin system VapC family toxin n=1 Tax=Halovivax limisalsi TaxID=1453760 RepID=UPI001FFD1B7D|nr:PIN domain-containing protein [Halovivax limisalsi]